MTRQHTTTATVLTLAATLALAACTPAPAPSPTPSTSSTTLATPTPTADTTTPPTLDPPASEDEATAAAIDAVDRYMTLRSAVFADPASPHDITTVTDGPAATRLHDEAAQLAAEGIHATGSFAFEVTAARTSEAIIDGSAIPFGTVTLDGCYDSTDVDFTYADGSAAPVTEQRRIQFHPVVVYRPSTRSWVVNDTATPDPVTSC